MSNEERGAAALARTGESTDGCAFHGRDTRKVDRDGWSGRRTAIRPI